MKNSWPWALAAVVLVAAFATLFRGEVQAARDLSAHVFPETFYLVERWSRGEVPLWLPHARLGQPFAALLYTQVFYAPRVLTGLLFGHVLGPNVMHLLHAAWSFAGLYLAARRLGLQRAFAFIAAAPFSLSPFFVEFAQNLSFASTAAWAGWVLWAAEGVRRAPDLRRTAWLAFFLGWAFHAGSPEMWLWEVLVVVAVLLPSRGAWRFGALALAWGGLLGAVVALPTLELSRTWTQPGEAASGALEWSVSLAQLLSIFVPDGDLPRTAAWWGGADQRFLFTLFTGAGGFLLALVGAGSRRVRPVVAIGAALVVLSLGRHFVVSEAVLSLPPFSLFRYPAKYLVGGLFCASLLAGFGARRLVALARKRRLEVPVAIVGFALGLVGASRLAFVREGFRDGAWWVVLVAVALFVVRRRAWALAGVVALELVAAPVERWERVKAQALTTPSRLAPLLRGEGRLSIRVDLDDVEHEACGPWDREGDPLLEGRDRLAALRFVEEDLRAVGGYGFREPWRLRAAFSHGAGAFDVAGVRTLVRETWAPAPPGAESVETSPIEDLWIWRRPSAHPRGFFVTRVRVGDDAAAFGGLDGSLEEVIVDRGPAFSSAPCAAAVETTEHSPEHVEQRVEACARGAVVLADAWYPGWTVAVDGQPAEGLRAWGFVRAVAVEPGRHEIHWRYQPWSFRLGALLSALALVAFGPLSRRRRGDLPRSL